MAIIIVAVVLLLAFTIRYVRYQFKAIREEEKKIFDTVFLKHFFWAIVNKHEWDKFYNKPHEIIIKRKVSKVKVSELKQVYFKEGIYIEAKSKNELKKIGRKVYCLSYEFIFEDKVIELYTFIPVLYKTFLRALNNTCFSCKINPNEGKLKIDNSFEDKIFIVSMETLFQSLNFAISNRIQLLEESSDRFLGIFSEVHETIKIVLKIQKLKSK